MHDTLTEALDLDGLLALLAEIEAGRVGAALRDTTEPSPLCHEILSGRPYTFLDDAPARGAPHPGGHPAPRPAGRPEEIGRLDPEAVARVRAEVAPDPRYPDELHDLLVQLVLLAGRAPLAAWIDGLVARGPGRCAGRALGREGRVLAGHRGRPQVAALLPGACR